MLSPAPPLAVVLLLWLTPQLLALLVAAAGLPLSANYPQPPERLAADLVIAAQLLSAALFFPWLLASWRSALTVILSGYPMLLLAGFLARTAPPALLWAAGYVSLWLIGMTLFSHLLQSYKNQRIAAALALAATLGGPILWYCRAEFFLASPAVNWSRAGALGPLLGALAQLHAPQPQAGPWLFALVPLVLTATVWLLRRRGR